MSNFAFARTLTTGATVAALATGILTISVAAYAHGVGNQTGGGGMKGVPTITANKVTTTKSMDHSYWRRLQLIDPGYTGPTYSCFYRHTPGGLSRSLWRHQLITKRDGASSAEGRARGGARPSACRKHRLTGACLRTSNVSDGFYLLCGSTGVHWYVYEPNPI